MALYNFIDVNKVSEGVALPSEALKINGAYIENQITGYRTLSVSGREALSPEIDTFETGVRDGSTLNYKRYPARTITVKYQLLAKTNAAFRDAYNKLASILNCIDAELIFNDEPDKFFIGTPSAIKDVEPGTNSVVGEFEILCTDPFKYSVTEYEVTPTLDGNTTFIVDYKGTQRAFPTFEVDFHEENEATAALTGKGDCGFVAFFNSEEKIIQIGNPEEKDGETYDKSQTLVNQSFKKSNSFGAAAQALWLRNQEVPYYGNTAIKRTGNVTARPAYSGAPDGEYYLTPSTWGSGTDQWFGPSVTRIIPIEAGNVKDFTLQYSQKLAIGNGSNDTKQFGGFTINVIASRLAMVRIDIIKPRTGKDGQLRVWINNKSIYDKPIDLSMNNKYFGHNSPSKGIVTNKSTTITKMGGQFNLNIGGIKISHFDDDLSNVGITEIDFQFFMHTSRAAISSNGLYGMKLTKHNCDTWRNIPNKFTANDVLLIDCGKGDIYLNDALTPALGALGNDWEEFCLKPGVNQIGVAYSDWIEPDYAPKFKMRYREVFI